MDLITETSLEALIQRATDTRNKSLDKAAVDAFCGLVRKNPECCYAASKMVASRIQSADEWEAMQGLSLLDRCMDSCGPTFHGEVGKFRFLNEMIKVVSPKFLGDRTSPKVRDTILALLHSWTISYPQEQKIREAFDMLKKQGVVSEPKQSNPSQCRHIIDVEFEQKLQKLLRSKNEQDLAAANRLIKVKVEESERRAVELERVKTNVRLLEEMMSNCADSQQHRELMAEVHTECERLRPSICKLASETVDTDMLAEVLEVNEEISRVLDQYQQIAVSKQQHPPSPSLLDLSSPAGESSQRLITDSTEVTSSSQTLNAALDTTLQQLSGLTLPVGQPVHPTSALQQLSGLTLPVGQPVHPTSALPSLHHQPNVVPSLLSAVPSHHQPSAVLSLHHLLSAVPSHHQPTIVPYLHHPIDEPSVVPSHYLHHPIDEPGAHHQLLSGAHPTIAPPPEKSSAQKAMEELDVLGESMLLQCKNDISVKCCNELDDVLLDTTATHGDTHLVSVQDDTQLVTVLDTTATHGDTHLVTVPDTTATEDNHLVTLPDNVKLADFTVTLQDIRPTAAAPVEVLQTGNGVVTVVHSAEQCGQHGVSHISIYVFTTTSTSKTPLTDYLLQVKLVKGCKCKLLAASRTDLPAHNPFLPPAAITQILLVSNPDAIHTSLTCMLSYTMDGETMTEVGQVESLPL